MSSQFEADQYPERPRILFLGWGDSSHTQSWINLLKDEPFNVRLFATTNAVPPDGWKVRTYVTACTSAPLDPAWRVRLRDSLKVNRFARSAPAWLGPRGWNLRGLAVPWLIKIIKDWRPDIVHTLGLEGAGEFYFDVIRHNGLARVGKWVLQLRGGSDLYPARLDPERYKEIARVLTSCDELLGDNWPDLALAHEMGVCQNRIARIGTAPGSGGIDVDLQAGKWSGKTSARRIILWPKVYQGPGSKAIPVYEALKLCWERIQPCEVHLLATSEKAWLYYWTLPKRIRQGCVLRGRITRAEVLEAMTQARVMIAPSLRDGIPNTMLEAMASGAFPIVSPLETIRGLVEEERNVLFARNLYPEEIASALVRAMTDDQLVDAAAQRNLELARRVADRNEIRSRVVKLYESLAGLTESPVTGFAASSG